MGIMIIMIMSMMIMISIILIENMHTDMSNTFSDTSGDKELLDAKIIIKLKLYDKEIDYNQVNGKSSTVPFF